MTTTPNTEIWDKLRRVPPEHLKGFQRAGGFRGTAIKPMWTFHRMTEVFGPCGQDWGIEKPEFQTITVGDEILVYCTVAAWFETADPNRTLKKNMVYGVGGDKVAAKGSSGLRTDDEAFKKAYTDALTNALKLLGAGADVHMGLWDGNKYVDEKPEAANEERHDRAPHIQEAPPPEKKPQAHDRNPIVRAEFDRITKGIREAAEFGTIDDLSIYWKNNQKSIKAMPAGWLKELEKEKDEAKEALERKAA